MPARSILKASAWNLEGLKLSIQVGLFERISQFERMIYNNKPPHSSHPLNYLFKIAAACCRSTFLSPLNKLKGFFRFTLPLFLPCRRNNRTTDSQVIKAEHSGSNLNIKKNVMKYFTNCSALNYWKPSAIITRGFFVKVKGTIFICLFGD